MRTVHTAGRRVITVAIPAEIGELAAALEVAIDASQEAGNRADLFELDQRTGCVMQLVGKFEGGGGTGELDPFPGTMRLAEVARLARWYPANEFGGDSVGTAEDVDRA